MADSIREKVVQAIVTNLQKIKVASGYKTNAGLSVERATPAFDESALPSIGVWDTSVSATAAFGVVTNALTVVIDAVGDCGQINPSVYVGMLSSDVQKVMLGTDRTLGGLAEGVQYSGDEAIWPDPGSSICGVQARYTVKYNTKIGDPYTSP